MKPLDDKKRRGSRYFLCTCGHRWSESVTLKESEWANEPMLRNVGSCAKCSKGKWK